VARVTLPFVVFWLQESRKVSLDPFTVIDLSVRGAPLGHVHIIVLAVVEMLIFVIVQDVDLLVII
jgi:hypothetical protein